MSDRIHVVQLDAPLHELAGEQASALGLSRTRYLQELLTTLAGKAAPASRDLRPTKLLVPDDIWAAVSEHARSRGGNVSSLVASALLADEYGQEQAS